MEVCSRNFCTFDFLFQCLASFLLFGKNRSYFFLRNFFINYFLFGSLFFKCLIKLTTNCSP